MYQDRPVHMSRIVYELTSYTSANKILAGVTSFPLGRALKISMALSAVRIDSQSAAIAAVLLMSTRRGNVLMSRAQVQHLSPMMHYFPSIDFQFSITNLTLPTDPLHVLPISVTITLDIILTRSSTLRRHDLTPLRVASHTRQTPRRVHVVTKTTGALRLGQKRPLDGGRGE